jgi:hypothetical protein
MGRSAFVINLDPAAEATGYRVDHDLRELISVTDAMDELHLGPNGGLVFCMEYLVDNMEWLTEILEGYGDDDYLIFDCPGQLELYTHIPVMRRISSLLSSLGFNVVGVYLLDATFVTDAAKLMSGSMTAMAAMTHLELPHINVLTKCDLVPKEQYEQFLVPDPEFLVEELHKATRPRFRRLNEAIGEVLGEYNLVQYVPLDISSEDSLTYLLRQVDHALQYGEDMEPRMPKEMEADGAGDGNFVDWAEGGDR